MTDTRETPVLDVASIDELVAIAQQNATHDNQHGYTQVPNFRPHDWVVAAMADAYELGARTACNRLNEVWKK